MSGKATRMPLGFLDLSLPLRLSDYRGCMVSLLLIAPTIDGTDVGEAWVAYQWAAGLASRHELTVLTYFKRGATPPSIQLPGVRVIEWPEPPVLGRAERLNSLMKPAYVPFFLRARRWILEAERRGEHFDLAHQVTPVAMRYPTPALGLGLPFVVGPVGGSLASPPGFSTEEGSSPWYTRLRGIDRWRLRHDPLLRGTYEDAACVLAIAPYVEETLAGLRLRRLEVMGETGINTMPAPVDRSSRGDATIRLLHVGRLVRTKGARDAIAALRHLADLVVVLDIIGDGPDRTVCEELVASLGLTDQVTFHGRLPRSEIDDFYRRADVFVFPSYREPGGNVQFEAMSHALPLVVSDRGGPAAAVDETCALVVHPTNPEQYARDIAQAVRRLANDRILRLRLGQGALTRVRHVGLWNSKFDAVDRIYSQVTQS